MRVETRDRATGQLVAAPYLTDLAGAPRTPPDAIAYDKRDEHHFVATGVGAELPSGDYRLVVERGTEYLPASADLAIRSGQTARHTIWLNRWIDMNRRGWYSGDLHNHRRVEEMPVLLQAEDLNLAPTLTDWIWEDRNVATAPKVSNAFRQAGGRHQYSVLDKEVERLEAGPGAVALLGRARRFRSKGIGSIRPIRSSARAPGCRAATSTRRRLSGAMAHSLRSV